MPKIWNLHCLKMIRLEKKKKTINKNKLTAILFFYLMKHI